MFRDEGLITILQGERRMADLFTKLNLKSEREIVVMNAPQSFESELKTLTGIAVARSLADVTHVRFAIVFVVRQAEVDEFAIELVAKAEGDAILWFAYPKQTSKRYTCDFHRDSGWDVLGRSGYEGVRIVAIDEDWSALRFRKVEYIKSLRRDLVRAISDHGKKNARGR